MVLIHPVYASTPPQIPHLPRTVAVVLPPSLAKTCAAYALPLGRSSYYILAPRGLQSHAEVGMDGSYGVSLRGRNIEVDFDSTGACAGCALYAAAVYFPSVRSEARKYGWRGTVLLERLPVRAVAWNAYLMLWGGVERDGRRAAGFAYYQPGSSHHEVVFVEGAVVAPARQVQQLAPWLFANAFSQWHVPAGRAR
ncbi:hypothetical protein GCM10010885_06920 [Alicyclobacillus cellulosilyticus]|uniref:Uncharacterized protein n=1 Tax=Alicyclobacillus cellulosilyticus TaxID=1003997 RepID=A0A917K4B1_9BACL|nr:DUF4850 domain-containing protein [Alicyclobacillus cellulosilyticus]GGJ00296.1 hypothetical protein GCM10010885_06920 [Alicyclobacillus cellulosilyticus]